MAKTIKQLEAEQNARFDSITNSIAQLALKLGTPPVIVQPITVPPLLTSDIRGPDLAQPPVVPTLPQPTPALGMHMLQQQVPVVPVVPPQQPPINRSEAGGQSRASNCACCGQRLRRGTVVVTTNEYIPSGMTTKWLELQQGLSVVIDGAVHQVNGQYLSNELKQRLHGQRATSAPGFLCGEPGSKHPRVALQVALLRRATTDEEQVQYANRVIKEAIRLQQAGHRA